LRDPEPYRLLVESISDYAIYMIDPAGLITSWNAGARRFKGYRAEEVIGTSFARFYTEEDRAARLPERALATALAEGSFESEGWRVRKDGERFWASIVIDPIRSTSGELIGFAKITRDLTAILETRTALELAREKLFQAEKMDAIGRLTGGVAHDFNNLLMAVLGSLELLRRRLPDEPRMLALVDNAISGAKRGAVLTQRLLTFARRQELRPAAIDIPTLVGGVVELIGGAIGATMRIETAFVDDLPKARSDPAQLELALLNLLVNARDAMPQGGVISIAASGHDAGEALPEGMAPGAYVCLSVTDTGEGMDQDTLGHATEPFFTTKGVGKGIGLGLPMADGLAEQSGGRLTIESIRDQGTTVRLWLPVAEEEMPQIHHETEADEIAMRRLHVLAVDDDALVLRNITLMLEDIGHVVCEAESGGEALALLQQEPRIDLLLTDQNMPGMTGMQQLRGARGNRPGLA
jgi:PAS domain S-box-containing protein